MKREEKSLHGPQAHCWLRLSHQGGRWLDRPNHVSPHATGNPITRSLAHGTPPPLPRVSYHSGKFLFYDIKESLTKKEMI